MAKTTQKTNWRVVIEPDDKYRRWDERGYREACEEILAQVKRHVDDNQYARVEFDTEEACEFCKYTWETEESGEPVCCGKAIEEWRKTQGAA